MDRNIPYAFLVCWVLLKLHVVLAKVPPPTNVTLLCHNMKNTLKWSYDKPSAGLRFKVVVRSLTVEAVELLVNLPAQDIDLSNFSDPDNDYSVFLSAVDGSGEESEEVPEEGIAFSYFKDTMATHKCNVDMPNVDVNVIVTANEGKSLHFRFNHPGLFYSTLKRKKRKTHDSLPKFEYHVEIINQKETHNGNCIKEVCEGKLPVDGNQEIYCLNITGEMKKMYVQAPRTFCSKPLTPEKNNILAYTLPILLVTVGVVILGSMVYIKRTRPSTEASASLNFTNNNGPLLTGMTDEKFSKLLVEPPSPTPLITPDQDKSTPSKVATSESNGWMRVTKSPAQDEAEPAQKGPQGEEEKGYTHGTYLEVDEEEEVHTAYEKRNLP